MTGTGMFFFSLGFVILRFRSLYSFVILDRAKLARIFDVFGADADATLTHHVNFGVLEDEGCMEAFVRGAFLAGGSVTDPDKRYHLEFLTGHGAVSREMFA